LFFPAAALPADARPHGLEGSVRALAAAAAVLSTAIVAADTIRWPCHAGLITGITRADWEAAEAAMRTAVLTWAAAKA
jgi:hypothetical protein